MRKHKFIFLCSLLLIAIQIFLVNCSHATENFDLYIVVDNNIYRDDLETCWGLSIYIKYRNISILFDTGCKSSTLLYNLDKLGIDPNNIDIVVLSHPHGDHIGGLEGLANVNKRFTLYIPNGFPRELINRYIEMRIDVHIIDNPTCIADGVYLTGGLSFGSMYEQALVINTSRGAIIITGCAHPGIENIVKFVADEMGFKDILMVCGGFHLMYASIDRIQKIIKVFDMYYVKVIMPIHCTGELAREIFKQTYDDRAILAGVGYHITLSDLSKLIIKFTGEHPSEQLIENETIESTSNIEEGKVIEERKSNVILVILISLAIFLVLLAGLFVYARVFKKS